MTAESSAPSRPPLAGPRRPADEIVVALAGQPNCGKSTLFNAVAGFKVNTGNFAGTSVAYAESRIRFEGRTIRLIDLPGTYSLTSHEPAEQVARDFLLSGEVDVIVNVADSSVLSRALELTLQLAELGVPMVACLNMIDDARRKGLELDLGRLTARTGIPAFGVIAVRGTGIEDLFRAVVRMADAPVAPLRPRYDRDVEQCVAGLCAQLPETVRQALPMEPRFVVLRLLEMDQDLERRVAAIDGDFLEMVRRERRGLAELHDWPEAEVLSSHRHALVLNLYEAVATHLGRRGPGAREQLDRFITNPVGGTVTVLASLLVTFAAAFFLGDLISGLVERPFGALRAAIGGLGHNLPAAILLGAVEGVIGGVGIVLPYMVPLLLLLSIYEDTGLLPRIAFMVDGLLHRVGLHGKSVVPLILGFGCNVPAVMATRNLENDRDRWTTLLIIPFVTCSARTVVVLALAGKYLGPLWAAGLVVLGLVVSLLVSYVLSRARRRHRSLGVIMEVPPLRRPYPRIVARKLWFRTREFVVVAWPVLVVASVALAVASYLGADAPVNRALSPLTESLLGLPAVTGIALFLGVFRKELALVMLATALGTSDIGVALDRGQILVFVLFTLLYVPCIATLLAIAKERGWRTAALSAGLNVAVATLVAGTAARLAWLL